MIRSWIRRGAVLAVAGACALAATSCSSSTQDAATINYDNATAQEHTTAHITRAHLLDQIEQLQGVPGFADLLKQSGLAGGEKGESANSSLTAAWLTQLIRQSVVNDEFAKQKLTVTDADRQAALQSVQQNYTPAIFAKMPKSLQDQLVNDQAKLNAVLSSCASGKLVSHILVRTEAQATAIYNQIKQGADFAQLAKTKSTDKGSAAQNGVLGCLTSGQFVPEFQNVADKLPVDVVSTPVKTQFGYHLILNRKWDPSFMSNQQIAQSVQQGAAAVLNARLKALKVRVDPRFGKWGSVRTQNGAAFQVTPPGKPDPANQRGGTTTTTPPPAATAPQGG